MLAPRFVLVEMGAYEECLAEARVAYRRARDAHTGPEREAAQREYAAALAKARLMGARLSREMHSAARAA